MFKKSPANGTKAANGAPKRNWTEFATGLPPLHRAIRFNKTEEVKKLLADPSVDPNKRAGDKSTPLIMAARVGNVEAVKLLLADSRVDPALTYGYDNRTAAGEARAKMSNTRNAAKQAQFNQIAKEIEDAILMYKPATLAAANAAPNAAPAARRNRKGRKTTRRNRKSQRKTRRRSS